MTAKEYARYFWLGFYENQVYHKKDISNSKKDRARKSALFALYEMKKYIDMRAVDFIDEVINEINLI